MHHAALVADLDLQRFGDRLPHRAERGRGGAWVRRRPEDEHLGGVVGIDERVPEHRDDGVPGDALHERARLLLERRAQLLALRADEPGAPARDEGALGRGQGALEEHGDVGVGHVGAGPPRAGPRALPPQLHQAVGDLAGELPTRPPGHGGRHGGLGLR